MSSLDRISFILLLIGALNLGLVGIGNFAGANYNVLNLILRGIPPLESVLYILIGVAGVYALKHFKKK